MLPLNFHGRPSEEVPSEQRCKHGGGIHLGEVWEHGVSGHSQWKDLSGYTSQQVPTTRGSSSQTEIVFVTLRKHPSIPILGRVFNQEVIVHLYLIFL